MTGWQPPPDPEPRDWRPVIYAALVAAIAIVAMIVLAVLGAR